MAFEPPAPSAVRNVPCARLACNGLTVVAKVARLWIENSAYISSSAESPLPS
jgi:hypothetical protein